MPHLQEGQSITSYYVEAHRIGRLPVMRRVEETVLGCDYGGVSYTTRKQADQIAGLLALAPSSRLLDVGSGAGWPGLYLARTTGCHVTLVDLPAEGLHTAAARAVRERMSSNCSVAVADGTALPFRGGSFDAICHSDVLC